MATETGSWEPRSFSRNGPVNRPRNHCWLMRSRGSGTRSVRTVRARPAEAGHEVMLEVRPPLEPWIACRRDGDPQGERRRLFGTTCRSYLPHVLCTAGAICRRKFLPRGRQGQSSGGIPQAAADECSRWASPGKATRGPGDRAAPPALRLAPLAAVPGVRLVSLQARRREQPRACRAVRSGARRRFRRRSDAFVGAPPS